MEAMTLEQVRDRIDKLAGQNKVYASVHVAELTEWMIALDAHLDQAVDVSDADVEAAGAAYFEQQWDILPPRSKAIYRNALRRALTSFAARALSVQKAGPVGEVTFDMVRIAEHLCPTDLPHLDKLRWKARKLTELLPASPTPGKEGA